MKKKTSLLTDVNCNQILRSCYLNNQYNFIHVDIHGITYIQDDEFTGINYDEITNSNFKHYIQNVLVRKCDVTYEEEDGLVHENFIFLGSFKKIIEFYISSLHDSKIYIIRFIRDRFQNNPLRSGPSLTQTGVGKLKIGVFNIPS